MKKLLILTLLMSFFGILKLESKSCKASNDCDSGETCIGGTCHPTIGAIKNVQTKAAEHLRNTADYLYAAAGQLTSLKKDLAELNIVSPEVSQCNPPCDKNKEFCANGQCVPNNTKP